MAESIWEVITVKSLDKRTTCDLKLNGDEAARKDIYSCYLVSAGALE
jgi:hypothetical protein